jgi:Flp pilus assembly protein TadB
VRGAVAEQQQERYTPSTMIETYRRRAVVFALGGLAGIFITWLLPVVLIVIFAIVCAAVLAFASAVLKRRAV